MKTLAKLLKDEIVLKAKIEKKESYGYMRKGNHLKEILDLNRQYRKENPTEYGYNSVITDYIMGKEKLAEELKDMVETQVYFSQRDLRREEQNKHEQEMIADGWTKLTEDMVKTALENKKKIAISAKHTNDWVTFKVEKILKPHYFDGQYGLMELRAKTRGYGLYQFEEAFCKLV
jgi:hypothetical protein